MTNKQRKAIVAVIQREIESCKRNASVCDANLEDGHEYYEWFVGLAGAWAEVLAEVEAIQ